jgi:dienelactone hydrolase
METRNLIRRRSLLSVVVVVVFFTIAPCKGTLLAQTPANEPVREQKPEQGQIPGDHYDPDDVKTYDDVVTEDRTVAIRGQSFKVHFYKNRDAATPMLAIYACGDGGWRGLAPRTAQQLAHVGFAVAGIDSKVYLRELSSPDNPMTIKTLGSDYAEIATGLRSYANVNANAPVYVYGWSLGAGFAIAVGSDQATRSNWAGIVAIGLPAQNQLVSGMAGNHANLRNPANARLGFRSEAVLSELSPVPLVMIESTSDTASPQKVSRKLFAAARDPKQYVLINAENHRFSGARPEFYSALENASTWIRQVRGDANHAERMSNSRNEGQK